ncbi:MAG: hypothetical protein K2W82_08135 [Candidatus Obscuribacterales bacterium]|nr:hypothetical protein [Candidatus Obscuribacterales bacterium]
MKTLFTDDLREIATRLREQSAGISQLDAAVSSVERAANRVGQSFSGSWLGYHSRVYYADFAAPPPGARFNPEWGLMLDRRMVSAMGGLSGSVGNWQEYLSETVASEILRMAGDPSFDTKESKASFEEFKKAKSETRSIIEALRLVHWDSYLEDLEAAINKLTMVDANTIASSQSSRSQFACRDQRAMAEGFQIPQHIMVLARLTVIRNSFSLCADLSALLQQMASHLDRIRSTNLVELNQATRLALRQISLNGGAVTLFKETQPTVVQYSNGTKSSVDFTDTELQYALSRRLLALEDDDAKTKIYSLTPQGRSFSAATPKLPLEGIHAKLTALKEESDAIALNEGIRFGSPKNGLYREPDVAPTFAKFANIVAQLNEHYPDYFSDLEVRAHEERSSAPDSLGELVELIHQSEILRLSQDVQSCATIIQRLLPKPKGQQIVHINIGTLQGILNTGEIKNVENIDINITTLSQTGNAELVDAFRTITEAIGKDESLAPEKREEALQRLEQLTQEAAKPPEKRLPAFSLKDSLHGLSEIIKTSASSLTIWHLVGKTIAAAFGVDLPQI